MNQEVKAGKKIKVLQLIHGLSMGGAETLVKDYVTLIDKNRFDIVVLCLNHHDDSPWEKAVEDTGVKVLYVEDQYPHWLKNNNYVIKEIRKSLAYLYVRRIIRKENPDVIHSHLPVNLYVKFTHPSKKTYIVHTVHNEPSALWFDKKGKGALEFWRRKRDLKAARWLVSKYGMQFIVLHNGMRREVNELFGVNNTLVLNNGIDFKRYNKALPKETIRAQLSIPDDAYVIGHIGRFSVQKNHAFLVEVFRELCKKKNNAYLLLVGKGELRKNIEDKLLQYGLNNRYLILENRDDIPDLLNAMDCFVFPSIYEGLGIVLIEAQKSGLPCYISDAVPEAAYVTNLAKKMYLDDGAEKWAEEICQTKISSEIVSNLNEWDMNNVIKKLERYYILGYEERN